MSVVQIPNWQKDVFSEKTLSAALRAALGVVGSPADVGVTIFIGAVGIALSAGSTFAWDWTAAPSVTAKIIQNWSVIASGFASAILGFLIAGFSIFAAMTDKSLFHDLAKIKSNGRDISDFKFIFYNFLYVFIQYLLYLSLTLLICFSFVKGSPVWLIGSIINIHNPDFAKFITLCMAVFYLSYSVYTLLLLRSFIWSMYQSLLIAIFADA
nr:hypothetical protein [uncultured Brevundimonas sp.]